MIRAALVTVASIVYVDEEPAECSDVQLSSKKPV